jgi:hypothetical protein
MLVFLTAFSVFNLFAGAAAAAKAVHLATPEGRERWASQRLYRVASALAITLPLVALCGTGLAWLGWRNGEAGAAPWVLAPVLWLILFGILFTLVDLAEDGILGNGLKRR